jgi:hypothetical protein
MEDTTPAMQYESHHRATHMQYLASKGRYQRLDVLPPDVDRYRLTEDGLERLAVLPIHLLMISQSDIERW